MIVYFVIVLLCLALTAFKGRLGRKISLAAICLLLTTTYYNGSDWRTYELTYDGYLLPPLYWEAGFLAYMELFRSAGVNYHIFAMVSKIAIFVLSIAFFFRHSPRPYFSAALYALLSGPALYIDDPLRQMMALSFFLAALHFVAEGKELRFYLAILLGFQFHQSVILFAPLYRLGLITKLRREAALFYIFFTTIFAIVYFLYSNASETFSYYDRHYLSNTEFSFGLTILCFVYLLYVIVASRKSMSVADGRLPLFALAIAYCIVGLFASANTDFLRINHYLVFGFILYFSHGNEGKSRFARLSVISMAAALFLNLTLLDYRYIPYTNYIQALLTDGELSFVERSRVHLR